MIKSLPTFINAIALLVLPMVASSCSNGVLGQATTKRQIARESQTALNQLCKHDQKANQLRQHAKAVVVFPSVTKAGFMVGGMTGNGAAFDANGNIHGYYQTNGLSYGLQAGVQKYGYAVFLMNNEAINYLNSSQGFDVGSAPSLVVLDRGYSTTLSSSSIKKHTYVFFFNQKGLMAGLGLQGSKITRINPN